MTTWCVIAGGGTAGHVVPGLAVAHALVERGHDPETILFLGSARGAEVTMVPDAGYPLEVLPGRGLNGRRLDLANLRAAWGIVRGVIRGLGIIRRHRPAVLLSLGGYAAVPGVVGAALWRVPIVVTEQNARASLANRLAGRVARACAGPTDATDLPRLVVTGNPVRSEIVAAGEIAADPAARSALRAELGVADDALLILVQSGSLGARSVNQAVIGWVEAAAADRPDVVVRHVIGRRDWQTEHAPTPEVRDGTTYDPVEYEDRTDRWMAAADVFVGRAGASTVAELAVVGVASILVPLPIAPRDAQRANAEVLVEVGAARIISDRDLDPARLGEVLDDLIADRDALAEMGQSARVAGHPDAAARVAELCEAHARG